jgi:hypothetical protein
MSRATKDWEKYCHTQEGMAWLIIRSMMDRLRPAYDLAVIGDESIKSTMPGLATLLGAKKAIAQKAVSTRRANRLAIANGEAPTHGAVGKKRVKSAQKSLLPVAKEQVAAEAKQGTAPVVTPATPNAPASPASPPAAATPGNGAPTH